MIVCVSSGNIAKITLAGRKDDRTALNVFWDKSPSPADIEECNLAFQAVTGKPVMESYKEDNPHLRAAEIRAFLEGKFRE